MFTVFLAVASPAQNSLRTAVNYDTDSKADVGVFRPSNNAWYLNKSDNSGAIIQQFGTATTDFPVPGDYDGDGKGDIAIWRDETGGWWFVRSSNGTVGAIAFGQTGDEPVARRYDNDAITDLAIVRRTGGSMIWYILSSASGNTSFSAAPWGIATTTVTDYVAPGDYDGDGRFDLAIQRPGATPTSQAIFWINKSSGGVDAVPWGFSNDIVVPGDYDGDGKTDVAVVREGATPSSNLIWYVRKSSDGNLIAIAFGITASDLTVQNDYDGDGKCDPAIWRDTNGTFFYANSSANYATLGAQQWGAPGDIPVAGYDTH
jgi:hypothetical protein